MSEKALVYPMFAMVVLSFTVLISLFRTRLKSVREGAVNAGYFQTYTGATEPEASLKLARHFVNLFEAPVLFYVVCLAAIVTGLSSGSFIALAWTYVALRVAHTFIHTRPNVLTWRIAAYFSSWFVLIAMWTYLLIFNL